MRSRHIYASGRDAQPFTTHDAFIGDTPRACTARDLRLAQRALFFREFATATASARSRSCCVSSTAADAIPARWPSAIAIRNRAKRWLRQERYTPILNVVMMTRRVQSRIDDMSREPAARDRPWPRRAAASTARPILAAAARHVRRRARHADKQAASPLRHITTKELSPPSG